MDCDRHLYSYRFHDYSVLHYAAFGSRNQPFIAGGSPRRFGRLSSFDDDDDDDK